MRSIRPIECGAWMCATEQLGTTYSVRARWVVNAAGTWTDAVNPRRFGVESPYKQGLEGGVTAYPARAGGAGGCVGTPIFCTYRTQMDTPLKIIEGGGFAA